MWKVGLENGASVNGGVHLEIGRVIEVCLVVFWASAFGAL